MHSFTDQDLYTFTVGRAVWTLPGRPRAGYRFYDRNGLTYNDAFLARLNQKVQAMASIRPTAQEIDFLSQKVAYLGDDYVDWLSKYEFNPDEVKYGLTDAGKLWMNIEGYWDRTIMWEVPLLYSVSSAYYETIDTDWNYTEAYERLLAKDKFIEDNRLATADGGTRRRRNFNTQEMVVRRMATRNNPYFIGTSNVFLAMKYGVKPIGTMSHQWPMGLAALFGHDRVYKLMLDKWLELYGREQSIVLPDTFGTRGFLKSFHAPYARKFAGIRHDSGDPFKFTDLVLAHYEVVGVDAKEKIIVFSDGLNLQRANEISNYVNGRAKVVCMIGTNLTNDFPDSEALNIVIKLDSINGKNIAKLSDVQGKATGTPEAISEAIYAHLQR